MSVAVELDPQVSRLVIVGASLAGLRAAEAARAAGFAGSITLVGAESHLPYDRPPLSKQFLEETALAPQLRADDFYASELNAELVLGNPAVGLDTEERTVKLVDGEVGYDALVIATGLSPRRLPGISGTDGVVSLRSVEDALSIRRALEDGTPLAIVGAGFIGAEIASAARNRGIPVTIIEATDHPLERALGRQMGAELSAMHGRHGSDLRCGVIVSDVIREGSRLTGLALSDGSSVAAELVLVSIGANPNTDWLRGSGIELAPDGGIRCDSNLQTSSPGVYAAGDIVWWPNRIMGTESRLEHWTSANEQGAISGRNAVARDSKQYETVPYVWSDWYGNRVQFAGRVGSEAPIVVSGTVESDRFVALYRDDDRVVGALAVNEPGRIMKDRRRIAEGAAWTDAVAVYAAPIG